MKEREKSKEDYKRLIIDMEAEKYRRKSEAMITGEERIEIRPSLCLSQHSAALDSAVMG